VSRAAASSISTASLAGLFIRFRVRSFRNGLRARGRGRSPLLVAAVGLLVSLAYVGLFIQAFSAIVAAGDAAAEVAALSVVTAGLALASLAAKAASSEAARAGSPENEFLLARPVSLPALVTARGLADAVTDPVGALFLLPVLVAAALSWRLGPATSLAIGVSTSMLVQVAISVLAYTTQILVVHIVPAARRRPVWMALRLGAALAMAVMWMLGTWVLRAPASLAARLSTWADVLAWSPGALIAAPLDALSRGDAGGVWLGLLGLAVVAGTATLLAAAIARRAGLQGWEEAGASWAEAAHAPASGRPLTAAGKDLRLVVRDRPQLLALVAMPAIFIGIQVFGAVGWSWSTATLARVSCLAYSLALYMATTGPLAHMQAERRAFWILRTVPVPLSRLLAGKARAWSFIVAATAAVAFVPLSFAIDAASAFDRFAAGVLVVGGAAAMTFLAVAMAAGGADLSDDQSTAVGPGTIYEFLLVGGLFNLVLVGDVATRLGGLALYAFAIWAHWRTGVERAGECMDAEAVRLRRFRIGDGASLLIVYALATRGLAALAPGIGAGTAANLQLAFGIALGIASAIYIARRPALPQRRGWPASAAMAIVLGAALGLAARGLGAVTPGALAPSLLPLAALAIAAEELLLRGVTQTALERELRHRWLAGAIGLALTVVVLAVAGGGTGLILPVLGAHAVAAAARASTGRTAAAWLARLAALGVSVL
jgi:hypothetical protein